MMPSLFLSHGAPDIALQTAPAAGFLRSLAQLAPERPSAILVASAHWETRATMVSAPEINDTIHDFGGFPAPLYEMRYPAPGALEVAKRSRELLKQAGFEADIDPRRGLDHGAWIPLRMAFPAADIPVSQISLQTHLGPAHALAVGRALAPLRSEGVLIIGSGSFTHDLSEVFAPRATGASPEPAWVSEFAQWVDAAIERNDEAALLDYRRRAPHASKNHPTEEHFLPLFVAMGAGKAGSAKRLHASTTYGVLRMDAYAFG